MDYLPDSVITLIQENPTFQHLASSSATAHLLHLRTTYLDPSIAHLRATYLDPYIIQPLATMLASSMPDLISVLVLALVLILSLKILDYGRRLVMFWVSLALRLLWWGVLISLGWYVYSVGIEKTGRDLGWVFGVVRGFVDGFRDGVEGGRGSGAASSGTSFAESAAGWAGYATVPGGRGR